MHGILIVDKPVGPTSHDVVAAARKALHEKQIGHTGTLDPAATGVLPLVVGRATKIARYVTGGDKRYVATIRLGVSTDTLDAEGKVVAEKPVTCTESDVRTALATFVGEIDQLPPMYSAKKQQGTRLYELARQGKEVEREPKRITIHELTLLETSLPDVVVDVRCSAGTYVRVLAQDLGDKLGCGGHLKALRRTEAGPFTLEGAVTLESLVENPKAALEHLLPVERALDHLPKIALPAGVVKMIRSGHQLSVADVRALDLPALRENDPVVLVSDHGELIAVAHAVIPTAELGNYRRDERAIKTERVMSGVHGAAD